MDNALTEEDLDFIQASGMPKIKEAAYHFTRGFLAQGKALPASEEEHPVIKALKSICADDRKCLERDFAIPSKGSLSDADIDAIVGGAISWINCQVKTSGKVQARLDEF